MALIRLTTVATIRGTVQLELQRPAAKNRALSSRMRFAVFKSRQIRVDGRKAGQATGNGLGSQRRERCCMA